MIAHYDKSTEKWFREHPDAETTVMECDKCGLFYKPSLGHKCKYDTKRDKTCKDCIHYAVCKIWCREANIPMSTECDFFKNKSDFVEVVRCKDCGMKGAAFCTAGDFPLTEKTKNNFCSYGEKK